MEHVVFFSAADGSPAYRRTANLEDAVRVVEHLRNVEGVEDVHVYSLDPVALSFRPYYRVEVGPSAVAQPTPAAPVAAPVHQEAPAPVELPAPAPAAAVFAPPEPLADPVALPVQPTAGPFSDAPFGAAPQEAAAAEIATEPVSPMAVVAHGDEDAGGNGRGARGLGFFTR